MENVLLRVKYVQIDFPVVGKCVDDISVVVYVSCLACFLLCTLRNCR